MHPPARGSALHWLLFFFDCWYFIDFCFFIACCY